MLQQDYENYSKAQMHSCPIASAVEIIAVQVGEKIISHCSKHVNGILNTKNAQPLLNHYTG